MVEAREGKTTHTAKKTLKGQESHGRRSFEAYEHARGRGEIWLSDAEKNRAIYEAELFAKQQRIDDIAAGARDDLLEGARDNNINW